MRVNSHQHTRAWKNVENRVQLCLSTNVNLKQAELSAYLANILLVVRADNFSSAEEQTAIERIRQEIGAKKGDLNHAEKLVTAGDYKFSRIGSLSAQISNLEDMLFLSLIRGKPSESKERIVNDFRLLIGVTEGQFSEMLSEIQARLNDSAPTILCKQCNQGISANVKFCPNCGEPTTPAEKIQLSFEIPETGYAIEFPDSGAANFPDALKKAEQSFRYETCLRGGETWHLAVFNGDQFMQAVDLAESLDGIRSRKIYINGKEESWWDVFAFMACASRRKISYKPTEYCFGVDERRLNLWGCNQLSMDFNDWAVWLTYGSFQKSNKGKNLYVWKFDKEKILHELNNNLFKVRFCPHLNANLIQTILELLPNEVEVSPLTEDWSFRSSSEKVPGSVVISEEHGAGNDVSWSATYCVFGIQPRGNQFAQKILKEAFRRCGIQEPKVDDFLK